MRARAGDIASQLAPLAEQVGAQPAVGDLEHRDPRPNAPGAFARTLLRERRMREADFPRELVGEPVWDILLDLLAAHEEGKCISITSACIASGVPSTTALRYITAMEQAGLVTRAACLTDRRTSYLKLTPSAHLKMTALLSRMAQARNFGVQAV
jgi:DNA-binding MarR family transcriptional regulator